MRENVVLNKSLDFSLKVIELYRFLAHHNEFVLSKQVLRSGTSIGANVEEATAAITKKDFTAKMTIAAKESRETRYWLRLLDKSQIVSYNYSIHLADIEELVKLTTAIVKSSQNNS